MKGIAFFLLGILTAFHSLAQVNEQDSLILVNLFNTTNGPNWYNNSNWLEGNVSTWFGIVVEDDNVVELNLRQNGLFGDFPDLTGLVAVRKIDFYNDALSGKVPDFTQNLELEILIISSNRQLTDLPDLSASAIKTLDVSDNKFEFDDLEPNMVIQTVTYDYQFPVSSEERIVNVAEGDNFVLERSAPGQFNTYKWIRNNMVVQEGPNSSLDVLNANLDHGGFYELVVTNSIVTGLELKYTFGDVFVVKNELFEWKDNIFVGEDKKAHSYGGYWADIDRDGDEDLFINTLADTFTNYLFINEGGGTFSKLETGSIVIDHIESRSVSWGDMNNDGYPDLFVGAYPEFIEGTMMQSVVYVNNKNLTFSRHVIDQTSSGGVWGDIDNDGFLDLGLHHEYSTTKFYLNKGETFENGPELATSTTWAASFVDIDNDNDLDFFQTYETGGSYGKDYLYLYKNEDGEFVRMETLENPIINGILGVTNRGFSWLDFDNDGDFDLLYLNAGSVLYENSDTFIFVNDGTGTFSKVSFQNLVGEKLGGARASTFGDYDNDGDLDLFLIGYFGTERLRTILLNKVESGYQISDQSFPGVNQYSQVSSADYDNDGFLDIFMASQSEENNSYLLRNKGNNNSWLKLRLIGNPSNRLGIGSRVEITTAGKLQSRQILSQSGMSSQNSMIAHFGLGNSTVVDEIKVFWPSGNVTTLNNQDVNLEMTIYETDRVEQTISFEPLSPIDIDVESLDLVGSSTSGLPVYFTSENDEIAEIVGLTLIPKTAGSTFIIAHQDGDDFFLPAEKVKQIIQINPVITSVSETISNYNAYPNPVVEKLYLDVEGDLNFEVYNLMGQKIMGVALTSEASKVIDFSLVPTGVYIAILQQNGRSDRFKIIRK